MSDLNPAENQTDSVIIDASPIETVKPGVAEQEIIERLNFLTRGHDADPTLQMMRGIVQKVLLESSS